MKPIAFAFACVVSIPALATPPGELADWTPTFVEEFTASTLDRTRWNTRNDLPRDTSDGKSRFLAWYPQTDGEGVSRVSVADGLATIEARREDWYASQSWGKRYGTGIIQSSPGSGTKRASPGFAQQFGYFEARLKGPASTARGTDAGFWLYSQSSWPPEIDVVEMPAAKRGAQVQFNYHWRDEQNIRRDAWKYVSVDSTQWQTYGLLWEADVLVWYINGVEKHRATSNIPQVPLFLNLALEVNGEANNNFYDNPADGVFPQQFQIDYVKVWERASPIPEPTLVALLPVGWALLLARPTRPPRRKSFSASIQVLRCR